MGCAAAIVLAFAPVASAQQIVPENFFSRVPASSGGQMAVSADTMVFNEINDTVTAQGNVGISFEGYRATADRAVYYQRTGRVELIGNVAFIDPEGVEYVADRIELEDGFKQGFLEAMTVAFPDGAYFTASQTEFDEGVERVYVEGIYAPCGTCIDAEGRTIGWKVRAARIITDEGEHTIYFEEPVLELLGVSVLYLPWLTLPSDRDVEMPILSYDNETGLGVSFPFFRTDVYGGELLFTPRLYSNQGVLLGLDWRQRLGDLDYTISASGIYQLNPDAFTGLASQRFRGAMQTTGTFTPTDEWTFGWSYTAFTDPAYMPDYRISSATVRNQVYAQYLDTDTFADIRLQQFVPVDNQPNWTAFENAVDRQALALPNARGEHVIDMGELGTVELSGKLLGLVRRADHRWGPFVHGYEGQSVHAMMQASWTNQYIVPAGFAISPYLALRGDLADYDGTSALGPAAQTIFDITPIAALDIRYPLLARTSGASHVIEPIVQLVYRDGEAVPGIINDDSQSFVFEDTNLFSFNRFAGIDRQETGLRANIGGALQTSFDGGGWLNLLAGQSFHLAGQNSFAVTDGSTVGIGSGMDIDSSYIVAGVEAGWGSLALGAKAQLDPTTGDIPRTQISARTAVDGYALNANYVYHAANAALGEARDRHEVGAGVTIPLMDYWRARGSVAWDLEASQWLESQAALEYDDDYLAFGIGTRFTGATHRSPNEFRVGLSFRLSTGGNRRLVDFDYSFDNID